jgi:hypothetical protein
LPIQSVERSLEGGFRFGCQVQVFAGDRMREDEIRGGEIKAVLPQPVVKKMMGLS